MQLLHVYPRDSTTRDGKPFWTLPKRPPRGLVLDESDPLHQAFIVSAASLRAREFGIPVPYWTPEARRQATMQARQLVLPAFVPSEHKAAAISSAVSKGAGKQADADDADSTPAAEPQGLDAIGLKVGARLRCA